MKIRESDLEKVGWRDISILLQPGNKYILVLVCETREQSDFFHNLITSNPFDLKILINAKNHYQLILQFLESDYTLGYDTERSVKDYPPLEWLKKSLVEYITTGIWLEDTGAGKGIWYNTALFPLKKRP